MATFSVTGWHRLCVLCFNISAFRRLNVVLSPYKYYKYTVPVFIVIIKCWKFEYTKLTDRKLSNLWSNNGQYDSRIILPTLKTAQMAHKNILFLVSISFFWFSDTVPGSVTFWYFFLVILSMTEHF